MICIGKAHVSGARHESGCFGDINGQILPDGMLRFHILLIPCNND